MNAPRPIDLAGRMDLDGDEQLSQREFAVGLVQLRKLDFDDDQSLSPAELQPFGAAQARPPTRPDSSMSVEIVSLTRRVSGYSLAQRLLARYDKQGDSEKQAANQQLGRTEIPLSAAAFAEADADDSGRLDFDELVLWTRQPHTSATLAIDIGLGETAKPRMKLGPTDAESSLRLRATSGTLTVGKSAIELALNGAAPLMNSAGAEFTAADADSNGYLDADEADRAYPGLMRLIDANRDGQVFREEWNHVQRVHLLLAQARVVISVEREDANLFDKLDLNGDARLDFIELREALDRAADWDGAVTPGEVSHQIRMTLRTGAAITGSQQLQQSPRIPALAPQSRAAGWFERMDQNQDGQVARREFLGTSALFAQLDRDRSGRLTPHEARLQPGNPHSGPQQSENRHVVIR
jgi:Ca2+-binding EF-hand superfamily protein